MVLFQYPLRPPWRPYETLGQATLRIKPQAARVEMSIPADEATGAPAMHLVSRQAVPDTQLSIGLLRPDGLFLVPLHQVRGSPRGCSPRGGLFPRPRAATGGADTHPKHCLARSAPRTALASAVSHCAEKDPGAASRPPRAAPASRTAPRPPPPGHGGGQPHTPSPPPRPRPSIAARPGPARAQVQQMRPDMSKVSKAAVTETTVRPAKSDREEAEATEDEARREARSEAQRISVQVKRKETERQMEIRLNSYAHLKQKEDDEEWRELQVVGQDLAGQLLEAVTGAEQYTAEVRPMRPGEYLDALMPTVPQELFATDEAAEAAAPVALADAPEHPSLSEDQKATIEAATMQILRKSHIINLASLKSLFRTAEEEDLRHAALLPDKVLSEAVLDLPGVRKAGKGACYILRTVGDPKADKLRNILLELLKAKDTGVRKVDVVATARTEGLEVDDSLYNKVVRALCVSRGTVWQLKAGDM